MEFSKNDITKIITSSIILVTILSLMELLKSIIEYNFYQLDKTCDKKEIKEKNLCNNHSCHKKFFSFIVIVSLATVICFFIN